MTPVTPSSEVLEKLQALRYSVNGDCYNGQEWELETIDAIRAALAERTQQEAQPDLHALAQKALAAYNGTLIDSAQEPGWKDLEISRQLAWMAVAEALWGRHSKEKEIE